MRNEQLISELSRLNAPNISPRMEIEKISFRLSYISFLMSLFSLN